MQSREITATVSACLVQRKGLPAIRFTFRIDDRFQTVFVKPLSVENSADLMEAGRALLELMNIKAWRQLGELISTVDNRDPHKD